MSCRRMTPPRSRPIPTPRPSCRRWDDRESPNHISKNLLHLSRLRVIITPLGALAQLVARNVRNVEVRGSNPLCSTTKKTACRRWAVFFVTKPMIKNPKNLRGQILSKDSHAQAGMSTANCESRVQNPLCSTIKKPLLSTRAKEAFSVGRNMV